MSSNVQLDQCVPAEAVLRVAGPGLARPGPTARTVGTAHPSPNVCALSRPAVVACKERWSCSENNDTGNRRSGCVVLKDNELLSVTGSFDTRLHVQWSRRGGRGGQEEAERKQVTVAALVAHRKRVTDGQGDKKRQHGDRSRRYANRCGWREARAPRS